MPLQQTSGNVTADAYGGGVAVVPNYIEDVFSTYLYTGNGSTQTITNGIDLAGKGGLVWIKSRNVSEANALYDTARGVNQQLQSNNTDASSNSSNTLTAFNSTGFTLGTNRTDPSVNYVSWTFRKQPKFFDVVTYTGNGALPNQLISHNLGSVPGCIIIKATSAARNWIVWHRGNGTTNYTALSLNLTAASGGSVGSGDLPTATQFKPGAFFDPDYNNGNETGVTYVAYLFAHNAGGFGLTGTDNVISCGSFTADGSGNATVNLGYEPQWILIKNATFAGSYWTIQDVMRSMPDDRNVPNSKRLFPNTSGAESDYGVVSPTSTGFISGGHGSGDTIIYIAIRRGPMKVPTDATKVFAPVNQTGGGTVTTNFPVDLLISTTPSQSAYRSVNDRLRGASTTSDVALYTNVTDAEAVGTGYGFGFDNNTGFKDANYSNSFTDVYWNFRRAPGFFDEVCYTGAGSGTTVNHNLAAAPELIITKRRNSTSNWGAYHSFTPTQNGYNYLDLSGAGFNADYGTASRAFQSQPTSTQFITGGQAQIDTSGSTFVAYLFASCPGVSKVGSYTGNGTTQTIDCGFAAGARFVLIKRTDSTGDWYVYDTARGMTTLTDPYLLLNSTAAESATLGSVTTVATGFALNATILAAINASGGSYVFLAIS